MPDLPLLRAYLDSHVLFSASLSAHSDFLELWRLRGITLITSPYSIHEIARNIRFPGQRERFESLLAQTETVSDADVRFVPAYAAVVAKDQPILAAAIAASVDFLVTGDKNHFGHLYGTAVSGVTVLSPANFLLRHGDRRMR